MTQYNTKYYAPIFGEEETQSLEKFASLVERGRIKPEVNTKDVAIKIIKGEYTGDFSEMIKPKQFSEATLEKRYQAALQKLNTKYGK